MHEPRTQYVPFDLNLDTADSGARENRDQISQEMNGKEEEKCNLFFFLATIQITSTRLYVHTRHPIIYNFLFCFRFLREK